MAHPKFTRWQADGPNVVHPFNNSPKIEEFSQRDRVLAHMVHELYCYTNKHLLQSSLIISACQCSVGDYWAWLQCVSLPLATAMAIKCLPCVLLFILYFDVSGEYFGIVNCNVTWFTMWIKLKKIRVEINYYYKFYLKKSINFYFLLYYLLATLLKYYKHKINIHVENLIANYLIQKKTI